MRSIHVVNIYVNIIEWSLLMLLNPVEDTACYTVQWLDVASVE